MFRSVIRTNYKKFAKIRRHVIIFFFNDTATTEIYTLSLHDALPICDRVVERLGGLLRRPAEHVAQDQYRSEEHTSELQSQSNLVCRLLLEKKKYNKNFSRADAPTV